MDNPNYLSLADAEQSLVDALVIESRMPEPDAPTLQGLQVSNRMELMQRLEGMGSHKDRVGLLLAYTSQFRPLEMCDDLMEDGLLPLSAARGEAAISLAMEGCWDEISRQDAEALEGWTRDANTGDRLTFLADVENRVSMALKHGLCPEADDNGNLRHVHQLGAKDVGLLQGILDNQWEPLAESQDQEHKVYIDPTHKRMLQVHQPSAALLGMPLYTEGQRPRTIREHDLHDAGLLPTVTRTQAATDDQFHAGIRQALIDIGQENLNTQLLEEKAHQAGPGLREAIAPLVKDAPASLATPGASHQSRTPGM